jgi:hypothetical protein
MDGFLRIDGLGEQNRIILASDSKADISAELMTRLLWGDL